jgi:hypothetical protein
MREDGPDLSEIKYNSYLWKNKVDFSLALGKRNKHGISPIGLWIVGRDGLRKGGGR